ncbi:MAG: proline--tRNA ligase [Candidatus Goldiibacteriota bacterium HGW-Goldbacteria-1]|nr:MAG: proline--tRNA ligase [Candidatus Goldiibacteriota bacterium HGW-Goldbacteria-1]
MRFSNALINTLRETPKEAETVAHKFMLRACMIKKLGAGIYDWMPLGFKSLQKVINIIREEMNKAGAQEVLLPVLSPAELWKETGRWNVYGKELMRIKDRHDNEFALGPTHEEVITDLVRREVNSYKQLPINLYQIQGKFRDEIRPRFGVMRSREFLMKDAYSFDRDEEGAMKSYRNMFETYVKICKRIGFKFRAVEADSGAIGGNLSSEFMVLAETGEDTIIYCEKCEYAANMEKAAFKKEPAMDAPEEALTKVHTPNIRTVEELAAFLGKKPEETAKTILYIVDGKKMAGAVIRGDREINEVKLKNALGAAELRLATPEEILEKTGAPVGFAGPINLREKGVRLAVDETAAYLKNTVTGGNENDYHYTGVNRGRDYQENLIADFAAAKKGDSCPKCGGELNEQKGIEMGHVFFLGNKYSKSMKATFLDESGKSKEMVMGCYGIGVSRVVAASIEQNNDENGIIWPMAIAPYEVNIVVVNAKYKEGMDYSEALYKQLKEAGVDVIMDDRDISPGVKFKDADLIGFPLRIVVGEKNFAAGQVEMSLRRDPKNRVMLDKGAAFEEIINIINKEKKGIL